MKKRKSSKKLKLNKKQITKLTEGILEMIQRGECSGACPKSNTCTCSNCIPK